MHVSICSLTGSNGNVWNANEGTTHRDQLFMVLWEAGIDGISGGMDPSNSHAEVLISFDDANIALTHSLRFLSESRL